MGRNGQALIAPSEQSLPGAAQEECVLQSEVEADPGGATSGGWGGLLLAMATTVLFYLFYH